VPGSGGRADERGVRRTARRIPGVVHLHQRRMVGRIRTLPAGRTRRRRGPRGKRCASPAGLRSATGVHHAHLVAVAGAARILALRARAVRIAQSAGRRPDAAAAAPPRDPGWRPVPVVAAGGDPGERAPGAHYACPLDLGARMWGDRSSGAGEPVAAVPGTRTMSARKLPGRYAWLALCCMLAGAFAAHAAGN